MIFFGLVIYKGAVRMIVYHIGLLIFFLLEVFIRNLKLHFYKALECRKQNQELTNRFQL